MRLSQLLAALGTPIPPHSEGVEVTGLTSDSRQVRPGYLFVAIRGAQVDAHRYIHDAVARGAVAVVAEGPAQVPPGLILVQVANSRWALSALAAAYYGYPARKLQLVGVTGTNGKTTVSFLVKQLAHRLGLAAGVIGTAGSLVNNQLVEEKTGYTTPEPQTLHRLLAQMVEMGTRVVSMEVSSHALEQQRVAHCSFDVAAFTNLTHEHLDYHKDMESYYRAKRTLFAQLAPGSVAVINVDDPYGRRLAGELPPGVRLITYGLGDGPADLTAQGIRFTVDQGSQFRLVAGDRELMVKAPGLFGTYNVMNALAAVGCGLGLGLPLEGLAAGLATVQPAPGRFQRVDLGQDFTVVVDYAHTPDGFEQLLSSVRQVQPPESRLIVVFGSAGHRDQSKRPEMGRVAGHYGDILVLTEEDPRSEDARSIMDQLASGVENPDCAVHKIEDRVEAIEAAVRMAAPGDVVLILGKGNETELEVRHPTTWTGDVPAAEAALRRRLDENRPARAGSA